MKKIFVMFLTVILFGVIALGFGGCKEKIIRPTFTAQSPRYSETELVLNKNLYTYFNYDNIPYGCDSYYEFLQYYKADFSKVSDKHFYVLNLGDPIDYLEADQSRHCNIYGNLNNDGKLENFYLTQGAEIYDKNVGGWLDNVDEIKPGYHNWTIYLSILCVPVENELNGELTLEFGKFQEKDGICDSFINIYCQSVCIATCEYHEGVAIPLSWYENYFKTNLIYGGNL